MAESGLQIILCIFTMLLASARIVGKLLKTVHIYEQLQPAFYYTLSDFYNKRQLVIKNRMRKYLSMRETITRFFNINDYFS